MQEEAIISPITRYVYNYVHCQVGYNNIYILLNNPLPRH